MEGCNVITPKHRCLNLDVQLKAGPSPLTSIQDHALIDGDGLELALLFNGGFELSKGCLAHAWDDPGIGMGFVGCYYGSNHG